MVFTIPNHSGRNHLNVSNVIDSEIVCVRRNGGKKQQICFLIVLLLSFVS